jgi:hypothetical protein
MATGIYYAVPSPRHYFNPRNGPFVIAFLATVVTISYSYLQLDVLPPWSGAPVEYPGLLNLPLNSSLGSESTLVGCLAAGVVALSDSPRTLLIPKRSISK